MCPLPPFPARHSCVENGCSDRSAQPVTESDARLVGCGRAGCANASTAAGKSISDMRGQIVADGGGRQRDVRVHLSPGPP